jgi:hypothetical protein
MTGIEIGVLTGVFVLAVFFNGLANAAFRNRPGPPPISTPLGFLSFGSFVGTVYLAYRGMGWVGAGGATVALIAGVALAAGFFRGRVPPIDR